MRDNSKAIPDAVIRCQSLPLPCQNYNSRMQHKVSLTLISVPIHEEIDKDWVDAWDSIQDLMENHYFDSGGSCVKLNPDKIAEYQDCPFRSSEIDFDEDPPLFPDSGDGFEITSDQELADGSHEVTYVIRVSVDFKVEADSEDEVKEICKSQLLDFVEIWDVGADDTVPTKEIEFISINKA